MAYNPQQSLYQQLAALGLIDSQEFGLGKLNTNFVAAMEAPFQRAGRHDMGGEDIFNLIVNADPYRTQVDPIGYAQELLQGGGVTPYGSMDEMTGSLDAMRDTGFVNPFKRVASGIGDLFTENGPGPLLVAGGLAGGLSGAFSGAGGASLGTGAPAGLAEEAAMLGIGGAGTVGGLAAPAVGGAAASTLAPVAGGSALSRVLNGGATAADWLSIAGIVGATGLGAYGAGKQADALTDIANQSRADRAPFLGKANEWLANPQAYIEGPGMASMDATLKRLSAERGNPIDSPTALGLATQAGMQDWRNAVTGFANIGLSGEDSRNSLLANAAGADAGKLSALGYGLGELTQPKDDLAALLKRLQKAGNGVLA